LVLRISSGVQNLDGLTFEGSPANQRTPPRANGMLFRELFDVWGYPEARGGSIDLAVKSVNECLVGTTQPGPVLHQRLEDRLQVEGGVADDFQHFAGGGLLLERLTEVTVALLQLAPQPLDFGFGAAG